MQPVDSPRNFVLFAIVFLSHWTSALLRFLFVVAITLPLHLSAQSTNEQKTIVVLGDSLAAGYGLELSQAFPALLQKEIQKHQLPYKVVNAGLSGDTTAGGLRRVDWVLRQKADVLLIELGGNDGLRGISPETTKKNLGDIVDRARKKLPNIQIVIAGMKMPPNMGADYGKKFEQTFAEVAKEKNATLIPFLLEGVGGRPGLNQPDRIHPTAEGHKIIAETVWAVLRQVLEKLENRSAGGPPAG